jgi:hypothetical protein
MSDEEQAVVSPEPEIPLPSAPHEEPAPMLDVHPPHETVHTWKDFFIHIATIVIGLLIAVGLEQMVEYLHHRELAKHAREMMAEERELNRQANRKNLFSLKMHEDYLFRNLPVLARIGPHTLGADDRIVLWTPGIVLKGVAWKSAQQSGAAAYLSNDELFRYDLIYSLQDYYNSAGLEAQDNILRAATVFYNSSVDRFDYAKAAREAPSDDAFGIHGEAAARRAFLDQAAGPEKLYLLTTAEVDELRKEIRRGIYDDETLSNACEALESAYDGFGGQQPGSELKR